MTQPAGPRRPQGRRQTSGEAGAPEREKRRVEELGFQARIESIFQRASERRAAEARPRKRSSREAVNASRRANVRRLRGLRPHRKRKAGARR